MLHGFSVPLTPEGRSALASPPPWHYSSDCLVIEYWADPAAVTALLPPGLTRDEKSAGRALFWFLDWQFTGSNDEITDPARYQYREAFVLLEGSFEDTPVTYCPFIFVDNDAAMARGWAQGYPKKLRQRLSDADLLGAQRGRGPPRQGQPLRRKSRCAWRATGDGPDPARGEGRRSVEGIQSSDDDASILSATDEGRPVETCPWMSSRCLSPTISPSWTFGQGRRS